MKKMSILLSLALVSTSLFAAQHERIKVTKRTAITKPYTQKVQSGQQCYEDTIEVDVKCGNADSNSIGVDTLIGAVAGIAIGNQIGKGSGRDVAKVLGGIGGAVTANQLRDDKTCKSYETVTRCNPRYEYKTIHKNIGYNNCGYYQGSEYCVQTKEPIDYIRVESTISIYAD